VLILRDLEFNFVGLEFPWRALGRNSGGLCENFGGCGKNPERFLQLPDVFWKSLEGLCNLPERFRQRPKGFRRLPEAFHRVTSRLVFTPLDRAYAFSYA